MARSYTSAIAHFWFIIRESPEAKHANLTILYQQNSAPTKMWRLERYARIVGEQQIFSSDRGPHNRPSDGNWIVCRR